MSTTSRLFRVYAESGGNIATALDILKQDGSSDASGAAWVLRRSRSRSPGAVEFTMHRNGSVDAVVPPVEIKVIAADGSVTHDKEWPSGKKLTPWDLNAYRREKHPTAERIIAYAGSLISCSPPIGGSVPALKEAS
jgi:hypothetical protein